MCVCVCVCVRVHVRVICEWVGWMERGVFFFLFVVVLFIDGLPLSVDWCPLISQCSMVIRRTRGLAAGLGILQPAAHGARQHGALYSRRARRAWEEHATGTPVLLMNAFESFEALFVTGRCLIRAALLSMAAVATCRRSPCVSTAGNRTLLKPLLCAPPLPTGGVLRAGGD